MRFAFFTLFLFSIFSIQAQTDSLSAGSVEVIAPYEFETLVEDYKKENKKTAAIKGYRIQIVSTTNRAQVYQTKSEFYRQFKDVPTYIEYQQPNFKLRIGNFRNKLEATKALTEVSEFYPDAFITRESISMDELVPDKEDE